MTHCLHKNVLDSTVIHIMCFSDCIHVIQINVSHMAESTFDVHSEEQYFDARTLAGHYTRRYVGVTVGRGAGDTDA